MRLDQFAGFRSSVKVSYYDVDFRNNNHRPSRQTCIHNSLHRHPISSTTLPPSLFLFPTQPHNPNKHIIPALKRHLRPNVPMLPLPRITQRKQYRDPAYHHARVVHGSHADRHRVREHEDDIEDDDVGACDGEDDGTPGRGDVELGRLLVILSMLSDSMGGYRRTCRSKAHISPPCK